MASVNFSFTLDVQEDRDVIAWLDRLPRGEKSAAIREVLQAHIEGQSVTLADVYQEVQAVRRKLDQGVTVNGGRNGAQGAPDEPPELAAALDDLLKM